MMDIRIGDNITVYAQTLSKTGAIDADNTPTFRVYEEDTTTPILTDNLTLIDASNTDGFYAKVVNCTSGNGFELWKTYCVRVFATTDSVSGVKLYEFRIVPVEDVYQAKVLLFDDNSGNTDRYVVIFFKNSEPITAGITSPQIQVYRVSDGTDLVAINNLTQIGSTGTYRRDEGANRITDGAGYIAKVTATIDGSTRTWLQPVGRDS